MITKTWAIIFGLISLLSGSVVEQIKKEVKTGTNAPTMGISETMQAELPVELENHRNPSDQRSERGSGRDSVPG